MSRSKHTPGPWTVETFTRDSGKQTSTTIMNVEGDNFVEIADIIDDCDEHEANANLIAAAPKLLDAAQSVLSTLEAMRKDDMIDGMIMVLREAIQEATKKQ